MASFESGYCILVREGEEPTTLLRCVVSAATDDFRNQLGLPPGYPLLVKIGGAILDRCLGDTRSSDDTQSVPGRAL